MGIGRREFLQLFGGTLAALTVNSSSAIAIRDDHYINRKLGIAFIKPHGWTFADVKQMGEVQAGQILDLDDSDLARELAESAELPVLTISKDQLSAAADRFTPGVTIYYDHFRFLDYLPDSIEVKVPLLEHARVDIDSCQSMLKHFRVASAPRSRRVSQCDAAEYEATFLFEHENMRPTPVRMRTLTVYQRPAIYTLRMYDALTSDPDMRFDYTSFMESIKMV
jgi:hypothetical protein